MKFTTKLIVALSILVGLFVGVEFYVQARIGKYKAQQQASIKPVPNRAEEIKKIETQVAETTKVADSHLKASQKFEARAKKRIESIGVTTKMDVVVEDLSSALEELKISHQAITSIQGLHLQEITILKEENLVLVNNSAVDKSRIAELERKLKREKILKWIGFALAGALVI